MRVSVVICTDGRAAALANTLDCLRYLDGPDFEVCVVQGPTEDGATELLAGWAGRLKHARNPERNLSVSRNMGIALAAGDIVAFVDDDGLPEPAWLLELLPAFDDPRVGGAGGLVMDHTGVSLQYRYASADRLGRADQGITEPPDHFNFPFSFNYPHVLGTNSAFRRDALVAIGGFDEEFEFYLDETDVCCRMIDAGWWIKALPNAMVHHKFLPSQIRTNDRVTRVLYPVLKNKLYFSLVNNRGHYPTATALTDMMAFIAENEAALRHHIESGLIELADLTQFRHDVERAWAVGLTRGLNGERRTRTLEHFHKHAAPFLAFPRPKPAGGRGTFVFVSQEYPGGRMGGVGRYIHQLARTIAGFGHHVHVLTRGEGHDRVDFEDSIWVHRPVPRDAPAPPPDGMAMPAQIWAHATTMLAELRVVMSRTTVTAVYAPIWDCEAAAIVLDGSVPVVTGLQTMLRFWLDSHPHHADDADFVRDFATPVLALESHLLRESAALHANSAAIARDIAAAYDVALDPSRTEVVPLGLEDWFCAPGVVPDPLPNGALRLLFVGRLESRKGIDVLLDVLPRLLRRHPGLHVDLVGNDTIPASDGRTYRAAFEAELPMDLAARVRFHGEVADERLRGFYRACDIFVAPSRFESFGLILVEAMMFGKPVVSCRTGGITEVVEDGHTALLAEPGDAVTLEACLEKLIGDATLRDGMGTAGRQRYEARFAPGPMADGVLALLWRVSSGVLA